MVHRYTDAFQAPDGDIMGSVLIGLVKSFQSIQAISSRTASHLVNGIESTNWYPISYYFDVINEVCRYGIDYDPILFRAGMTFIEDWYLHGGGKDVVASAGDFLRLQGSEKGFSAVHRGDPAVIGWQELTLLDEASGNAIITGINLYPREFERGVFYGGMLLTGDIEFADVQCREEPYNHQLSKKTTTIKFIKKPDSATSGLIDSVLSDAMSPADLPISQPLLEAMAWRLKRLDEQIRHDTRYFQQSSLLLSKATDEIFKLTHQLEKIAHVDDLTGLLNRRAIFEQARGLLAIYSRSRSPISFIMIDVDNFKFINDSWGHAAGDETLRSVSTQLMCRLREKDLLGRIGGEEFLVVLPDTSMSNAMEVAESLRKMIEEHVQSTPDGRRIPLSISLGVAGGDLAEELDLETYVRRADKALYLSKSNGRNRVTGYGSPEI